MIEVDTLYTSPEVFEAYDGLGLDALAASLNFFNNKRNYLLFEVAVTGRQSLSGDSYGLVSIKFSFVNLKLSSLKTRVLNIRVKEDIENCIGVGTIIRDAMCMLQDFGLFLTHSNAKEVVYTHFDNLFGEYTQKELESSIVIIPTLYIKSSIMGDTDLLFAVNSKKDPSFSFLVKTRCKLIKEQQEKMPETFWNAMAYSIKLAISEDHSFTEDTKISLRNFYNYFPEKNQERLTADELLLLEVL